MLYFKHNDLAAKYHVSLKTVHNWIDSAKQGKLELQLHELKGRIYIANTTQNLATLDRQAQKGKKYRNSLHHKVATPVEEFYELYSRQQILDIISNLNIHREIPRQYNYFDGGATNWDRYARRMLAEKTPNLFKSTVNLIHDNLESLDRLIEGRKRINVVDLGPGNAQPVKELLEHLLKKGILHRYIAVDISESMLKLAEKNIKKWFGNSIKFEGYTRDMTFQRFDDLIVDDMLDKDADKTLNLVLLLGSTPVNFRNPDDALKVICSSMDQNDLLIYTTKPDSEARRKFFDFSPVPGLSAVLSPNHRLALDLLGFDESHYDVEMGFNGQKRLRYIRIRLKVGLTIKFKFKTGERNVTLEKGDTILMWRAWHRSTLEIIGEFEDCGFALLQSSLTKDREYLLTISGVNKHPSL